MVKAGLKPFRFPGHVLVDESAVYGPVCAILLVNLEGFILLVFIYCFKSVHFELIVVSLPAGITDKLLQSTVNLHPLGVVSTLYTPSVFYPYSIHILGLIHVGSLVFKSTLYAVLYTELSSAEVQ